MQYGLQTKKRMGIPVSQVRLLGSIRKEKREEVEK